MISHTVILITGANTGLGLETVKALCRSPEAHMILLGGRSLQRAITATKEVQKDFPDSHSVITAIQVDIEDDNSISEAFEYVVKQYGRLDVLINNAGGQFDQQLSLGNMTMREVWNKSWNVNTTGTHILTHTFAPLLLKSTDPRLIFIASGTSTLAETENLSLKMNQSPAKGWPKLSYGIPAYRSSKTGMNMMMREWARILREDGVKLWCISPGFLATGLGGGREMNKQMGAIDPMVGANFVRDIVHGACDQNVGKVIRLNEIQPW